MPVKKKCPDELRQRAVRLVLDAQSDRSTATGAIGRVAQQLGINKETFEGGSTKPKSMPVISQERQRRMPSGYSIVKSERAAATRECDFAVSIGFFAAELDRLSQW